MKSTFSVDESELLLDFSDEEQEMERIESPGFLVVALVLLVIYAITSRPVLYASIDEWVSQIGRGIAFGARVLIGPLTGVGG